MATIWENGSTRRFFSNPWVGVIGTIASVVGVGLAVFFYLSDRRTRDLTFCVSPERTRIVKAGESSKISVLYDKRQIDTDVSGVRVAIWNNGSIPIRSGDILRPIRLRMPGCRILEATVAKQTADVVGAKLDQSDIANGNLGIGWTILERGDGVLIQLIYAGESGATVGIEGIMEGQREVSKGQQRPKESIFLQLGVLLLVSVGVYSWALSSIKSAMRWVHSLAHGTEDRSASVRTRITVIAAAFVCAMVAFCFGWWGFRIGSARAPFEF